ncbi:MAG: hybrid sensor histidine kinase/response regulator transcription factor, partial [Bacteroidales bacterium]
TGPGIPDTEKEKIFDRFYQVSQTRKGKNEGTGVGLYLVRKFTEMHHGELELKTKLNKGSRFIVSIPTHKKAFSDEEIMAGSDVKASGKIRDIATINRAESFESHAAAKENRPLVLIVEDNTDLNAFLVKNLSEKFHVIHAFDGKEGLEKAISRIPDLIVTDLMIPQMDGIEMSGEIKSNEKTRHIPIIMLTAKADRSSKLEGLEEGGDDYIVKPFDMEELILKIGNQIQRQKLLRDKIRKEFITAAEEQEVPSQEDSLLKKTLELMKEHLAEPEFYVSDLCRELCISRMQLYRKIQALTGFKPGELLRILRLKTAARMFKNGHKNVTQVMYEVGISNPSNFARIFRKQFGVNPSEFIEENRMAR